MTSEKGFIPAVRIKNRMSRGQSISDFFCDQQRLAIEDIRALYCHPSEFSIEQEFEKLYQRYCLQPIEIIDEEIYATPPRLGSHMTRDGYGRNVRAEFSEMTLCVPIIPNKAVPQILSLAASTSWSTGDPDFRYNEDQSQFEIPFIIEKAEQCAHVLKRTVEEFKEFIEWKNRDIRGGHRCLESTIRKHLAQRLESLERGAVDAELISSNLGLPIKEVPRSEQMNETKRPQKVKETKTMSKIQLFFSHSSVDQELAKSLVELVVGTIEIADEAIRCTSVPGYKLTTGDHTSSTLKKDLKSSSVVIGLLTKQSLSSSYVLFELGAAWGADTRIKPLLGPDADYSELPGPLKENNVVKISDRHAMVQLLNELSEPLGVTMKNAARVDWKVTAFVDQVSGLPKP